MTSGNVVSYKAIIDKLLRDFPFDEKFTDEEGLEWLAEFMAHTNSGAVMKADIAYLDACDGRATLPHDLHRIKQVVQITGVETADDAKCGGGKMIPMRWSTDQFHSRYHLDSRDYTTQSRSTYTVGQGFIFPSFSKGILAISYEAIPTDECGYPTIPGDQQWLEGATFYLAYKIARKMWLRNEITSDKFQLIERDRDWYFQQAVNHSKQWNGVDEAESFKNQLIRTIPSIQDHGSFFANMQLPEQRYFRGASNGGTTTGNGQATNIKTGIPPVLSQTAPDYLPLLITGSAHSITSNSAVVTNNLTSYGNTTIVQHGLVYSTSTNPSTSDSVVSLGAIAAVGQFDTSLGGLLANTTYYVRAFATSMSGNTNTPANRTSYGNETSFTTLP